MSSSIKHVGVDSILYNSVKDTLVTTGVMAIDTWFKIKAVAASGSALPITASQQLGSVFKSPQNIGDQITLVAGDEVWPLVLTEICKVDVEISAEMGVIETTDSCDAPYMSSIPDGYSNLTGTIGTMQRYDEATDELIEVTKDLLVKFLDIVEDDGEGVYTLSAKDDDDLLLQLLMNKEATAVGQKRNWWLIPVILNSLSANNALKDVNKADYSWTKGQGPASIYIREIVA